MFSSWAYILIGDNDTGKTSFQRYLVEFLCNQIYKRLRTNKTRQITHPRAPRKLETLFTANRSYQEKIGEYKSVQNYVDNYVDDADICVLSSHAHGNCIDDVREMITLLSARGYNVAGVFWSNAFDNSSQAISRDLPWRERLWVENPIVDSQKSALLQIKRQAAEFAELLIERARIQ